MKKKIMLLGSGELGKEFVIAAKQLGQYVVAVDSYSNAPAMQVADEFEVIDMLNGSVLDAIVAKHQPDIIVPEVEAIRTERFYDYEKKNVQVVPSAKAANFTMNRKAIRDLAAKTLNLKTAKYEYATTMDEFKLAVAKIGIPCVVKPLMSSSGKGQSVLKNENDVEAVWDYAMKGSRGDLAEVIVEEFIHFKSEITLLTVTQKNGHTLFCSPIGHRQEKGDYRESWQPSQTTDAQLKSAQDMALKITNELTGAGLWGVEFFLGDNDEVWFSELSPRPHDTGMVTLAGTQNFTEFQLHCRSVLGLPITHIEQYRNGASAVVLATEESKNFSITGIDSALKMKNSDVKIFGKPSTRINRRMGVALTWSTNGEPVQELVKKAVQCASEIKISYQ